MALGHGRDGLTFRAGYLSRQPAFRESYALAARRRVRFIFGRVGGVAGSVDHFCR